MAEALVSNMETNTKIATIQCSRDYAIIHPWVMRMDSNKSYEPKKNKHGYPHISFRRRRLGITQKVEVHRILAYQMYGDVIFDPGVQVRHKDNDKSNFKPDNILIGTAMDNHLDNPERVNALKVSACIREGKRRRSFSDNERNVIFSERRDGATIRKLSSKWRCSKSTMSYLLRGITYKTPKFTEAWQSDLLPSFAKGAI